MGRRSFVEKHQGLFDCKFIKKVGNQSELAQLGQLTLSTLFADTNLRITDVNQRKPQSLVLCKCSLLLSRCHSNLDIEHRRSIAHLFVRP